MIDTHAAERDLLGAMLTTTEAQKLGLDACVAADFSDDRHRAMFQAIADLYHQGAAVDTATVHAETGIPRAALSALVAGSPSSYHAGDYARIVIEQSAIRRAIILADELSACLRANDLDGAVALLTDGPGRIAAPASDVGFAPDARELAEMEFSSEFVVRGLIEFLEVAMIVGAEGYGKSELLRQIGVCVASGLHPFTRVRIQSRPVLLVDCENTQAQISRSLKRLLRTAGDDYQGGFFVEARPQGMDLTSRRDVRWLDALLGKHDPDLFILGPLYKAYRGSEGRSKSSEEAAEQVSSAIDELKVKHHCAVMIEAHAGHGSSNDRDQWRPRGSSLWMGWPTFGLGLKPLGDVAKREVQIVRWRGDREMGREWPHALCAGAVWPWEPLETRSMP